MRVLLASLAALILAACANPSAQPAENSDSPEQMTLVLDFAPGGIHSGIYSAAAEGYFEEANLEVDIQLPTSPADTLRLVEAGQATVGIAPLWDVASLRASGVDVVAFLALEQVPLVSLLSTRTIGITDPSQLTGSTIGVTGVASDEAIARFILDSAGADSSQVDFVTIGFDAVGHLIGQSVDAAVGFWNAEAVALELNGEDPVIFRPDQYGAPAFPELVLFASEETLTDRAPVIDSFTSALARGYRFAVEHPDSAIDNLASLVDGVDEAFARAEFDKVAPHFLDSEGRYGHLDPAGIEDQLQWAVDNGLIAEAPDGLVTTDFLP